MKLWIFGRKKKSREEAKKRLQTIVSTRRETLPKASVYTFRGSRSGSEALKKRVISWAMETFNVDKDKVRVELEEGEGHVIIITNVSLR